MKHLFSRPNKLYILCLLLVPISFFGQKSTKGPIYSESKHYYPDIQGEDDLNFYVTSSNLIQSFNKKTMAQKYSIELEDEITEGKSRLSLARVIYVKGKFVVFYESFVKGAKKQNQYKLYAQAYAADNGQKTGSRQVILDIPTEKKKRKGYFKILRSKDKSKFFIEHEAYYKKLRKRLRTFILMDEDLNVLHESEQDSDLDIPYYFIIDNDGTMYTTRFNSLLGSITVVSYDANKDFEKWEEDIQLELNSTLVSINSINLNINKNNELTLTGLYSTEKELQLKKKKKKKVMTLTGTFYVSIDSESKEVKHNKVSLFTEQFLEEFKTEKEIAKGTEGNVTNSFGLMKVIDRGEEGSIVIGENYSYQYTISDGSSGESESFGDLLVMNFNADGELIWSKRIPKNQMFYYSTNGLMTFSSRGFKMFYVPSRIQTVKYFSYFAGIYNDELVIYFNDKAKNTVTKDVHAKLSPVKKPASTVPHKYSIDLKTGVETGSLDLEISDNRLTLLPRMSFQNGDNAPAYMLSQKGSKYRYLRIK